MDPVMSDDSIFVVRRGDIVINTSDAASARIATAMLMHLDAQDREIQSLRKRLRREAERHAGAEASYLSKIHGLRSQLNVEHQKNLRKI